MAEQEPVFSTADGHDPEIGVIYYYIYNEIILTCTPVPGWTPEGKLCTVLKNSYGNAAMMIIKPWTAGEVSTVSVSWINLAEVYFDKTYCINKIIQNQKEKIVSKQKEIQTIQDTIDDWNRKKNNT